MNPVQYVLGIAAALATLILVVELLRRKKLRERHAMWWLLAGILAVFLSVFPGIFTSLAVILGFELPVNLVFFSSLFLLFLVAVQHSSELTKVEAENRVMSEEITLLELRVRELEERNK